MDEKRTVEIDGATWLLPFTIMRNHLSYRWEILDGERSGIAEGYGAAEAEYIAAALNDYRPWRHPRLGELPISAGLYIVTLRYARRGLTVVLEYDGELWWPRQSRRVPVAQQDVIAWRELPDPAPVLEEGNDES